MALRLWGLQNKGQSIFQSVSERNGVATNGTRAAPRNTALVEASVKGTYNGHGTAPVGPPAAAAGGGGGGGRGGGGGGDHIVSASSYGAAVERERERRRGSKVDTGPMAAGGE